METEKSTILAAIKDTNWKKLAESVEQDIISWRRYLHQNPELSFQEYHTAQYIYEQLSSFGNLIIDRPTETSVVARLVGPKKGKKIAFRADIDALPITEATKLKFQSKNAGVMHACGHDCHTAILLGAVKILSQYKQNIKGEIRFIFQHAEELPPGGASELIEVGVIDDIEYIFGLHVMPLFPTGTMGIKEGIYLASCDIFDIVIQGKGGHAGMPQFTIDTIPIGAELVLALQTIVSRKLNPHKAPVISITKFHSGSKADEASGSNVISDESYISGTIRTHDQEIRDQTPILIEQVIKGVTLAHGASYEFEIRERGYPIAYNDPQATELSRKVIREILGEKSLIEMDEAAFGAEDFSSYQKKIPGCFSFLGTRDKKQGSVHILHSPFFTVDENALKIGVQYYLQLAFELNF